MDYFAAERLRSVYCDGWSLDRTNGEPAYAQIEARIAELVRSGALAIGDRVPSERDLADWSGVSRPTARAALSALARAGLLERGVGRRGTTVTANAIVRDLGHFRGFTALAHRNGTEPEWRVLALESGPAGEAIAPELQIAPGDPVWRLARLRLAHGEPCAIEHSWIPAGRFLGLEQQDLTGSIYELMREVYDLEPARVGEQLEPVIASGEQATMLEVPLGAALMQVVHTAYSTTGVPLEHARDVHRPDRSQFLVDVAIRGG